MKKLGIVIIVIIALFFVYKHNSAKINQWLASSLHITIPGTQTNIADLQAQITDGWSGDFVREQLDKFIIKDGIKLPEGWKLDQLKIQDTYFTVIIPENPDGPDDYIALKVLVADTNKLPTPRLCTHEGARVTCVVGENLETHRTFSLLTYL